MRKVSQGDTIIVTEWGKTVAEMRPAAEQPASRLAAMVSAGQRHPMRAYDAIHLAAALRWRSLLGAEVLFLAFDKELLAAARNEGLVTAAEVWDRADQQPDCGAG